MKNIKLTTPNSAIPRRTRIKSVATLFSFLIIALLFGCGTKDSPNKAESKFIDDFRKIDNLHKEREISKVVTLLDSLKPLIASSDIESLTHYYIFRSQAVFPSKRLMNVYADSLLGLFIDEKAKTKNKTEYIRALILKSDVLLYFKQYDKVVNYYFKVSNLIAKEKDPTSYADFIAKIAQIYYLQGKFTTSAKYQLDAYRAIQNAKDVDPSNLFYYTQAALNNAGFSYERAEKLDSALYLYQKNLAYILNQENDTDVSLGQVLAAKIVALDNIGGLYAKKGDYLKAKNYLEECISINSTSAELSKVTAYIKLAKVYSATAHKEKADSILNITEKLITSEPELSLENSLKLYKAKSDLAYSLGNYKSAVENLKLYNANLDSLNKVNSDLSKVDIDQAFKNLEDQQALEYLEKTNQSKTIYLIGAILCGLMLLVIVWLVLKNAKQAKKAEKETVANNKQLEKALLSLENRNKDYAKMMKVMAHDLKNPIGGMVGIATLLLQEEERFNAEDKEMLQLIESSGTNAIEMINQLLNSGLAIENELLKKESIDLQQLLRQCTELLQYKADEKKQKIIFISSGPTIVSIAREKMWRVFNNLIVNAIKFSLPKTEIVVVLKRLEKSVRVKIVDHGIGVPENDKTKIFEMFTSAKRPGTAGEQPFGIGLSISKQIVESHEGKIWLEDNTDGGTIFYVELPIRF